MPRASSETKILAGKPVVKWTRTPVELVLHHMAGNPDLENLFAAYPELTVDDVKAVLMYARAVVEDSQQAACGTPAAQA